MPRSHERSIVMNPNSSGSLEPHHSHDSGSGQFSAASKDATTRIRGHFANFERYVNRALAYHARGELAPAAAYAAIAAHVAAQSHGGTFWSPRLERLLTSIGAQIETASGNDARPWSRGPFKRVLQVCTQVAPIGGHTKMLCQWIKVDNGRTHSLVLTQHRGPVPAYVKETIAQSGGSFTQLNHRMGGQLDWARRLRSIACQHDLVVLHIHCEDVVPVMAFAETAQCPPVLFLNHADHLFWLGSGIAHLVINLRDAAQDLARSRRGIEACRNILMPTLVEPTVRTQSRAEAKRALDMDPDSVLLLSVARGPKYRTMNGVTFADLHVPVLRDHPNATLLVVGAGEPPDWRAARAAVGGRIISLPEQPACKRFFEAADIYVDSYPFVSSTSMMEAAGYGLPMVTIFKAPEESRIYGINHVALVGTALQAASDSEYSATLARLITDQPYRERTGMVAREAVANAHTPPGWGESLEAVYARAAELPPLDNATMLANAGTEKPYFGEPDCRHGEIFEGNYPSVNFVKSYMGMLPPRHHFEHWNKLRRAGLFNGPFEAATYLLPEWLKRAVKDR